ncbi:MAG: hypothetical protein IJF40_00390 [Clostridia bacterium]|nr:hypothetical protein [Clostridia bacterium]
MKKFLSAALAAIILMVSVLSLNVFAAESTKTEALLAKLNEAKEVSVTLTAGDLNFLGKATGATDTIYIKGGNVAYEYKTNFVTARIVLDNNALYGFIPAFPIFYVKLDTPSLSNLDVWGLIEGATNVTLSVLQYVKSYNETVKGKTYYVEEFNDRAQVTSKFYYDGDDLKILKVTDAKTLSVQNTYFEKISFTVDDSVFKRPVLALNLTPFFKAFFLSMIVPK